MTHAFLPLLRKSAHPVVVNVTSGLGSFAATHDAGRIESVIVWTENDEARMRELLALGVDGILTDHPDVLRGIVGGEPGRVEEAPP